VLTRLPTLTPVSLAGCHCSVGIPTIEIHPFHTHARESFRHNSFIARFVAARLLARPASYVLAWDAAVTVVERAKFG